MLGLLRLLTNPKVMNNNPFTPDQAWQAYRRLIALPEVCFVYELPTLESKMAAWSDSATFPVRRWTDCYLAALALTGGYRMVSFDRDYYSFNGLEFLHLTP
jgi:predicted nucleic acid-binding protein